MTSERQKIQFMKNEKNNVKFSIGEECHFENPTLMMQVSSFFAFESYHLSGFLELFKLLDIDLQFPINVSGKNRRNLEITDLSGNKIILNLSCNEITVKTLNDSGDLIVHVYSSMNFSLISIKIYRKNKQAFWVSFGDLYSSILFYISEKEYVVVENLPKYVHNPIFYFNTCSTLSTIFNSGVLANRQEESSFAYFTICVFNSCIDSHLSFYKDNKLIEFLS